MISDYKLFLHYVTTTKTKQMSTIKYMYKVWSTPRRKASTTRIGNEGLKIVNSNVFLTQDLSCLDQPDKNHHMLNITLQLTVLYSHWVNDCQNLEQTSGGRWYMLSNQWQAENNISCRPITTQVKMRLISRRALSLHRANLFTYTFYSVKIVTSLLFTSFLLL